MFSHHQTETVTDDAVTLCRLSRCKRSRLLCVVGCLAKPVCFSKYCDIKRLPSTAALLARYTCRPTQSMATSSLLNFTHALPYSCQNFSRLENTVDLSSPLTARQRSWLSGCCFCCFYYRNMSGDQTTLTLGQCRQPVTYAYHMCILTLGSFYLVIL